MLKLFSKSRWMLSLVFVSAVLAEEPRQRNFEFSYVGAVTGLEAGSPARIWLPVASSDADQQVERLAVELPGEVQETEETTYGNRILYFAAAADQQGEIPFRVVYRVVRREVVLNHVERAELDSERMFRLPSTHIPIDFKLRSSLLGSRTLPRDPFDLARTLYAAVDQRMRIDKPLGGQWGRGDATWACSSGYGNCTDFHSLFLSACRTSGIPGKFEIGFPIPSGSQGKVPGYHCWARFFVDGRWIPVDISEADKHPELSGYYFGNLRADRVLFSTGRDLQLVPPAAIKQLNFFVYPHVEVEGKVHQSFRKEFQFREIN